MIFFAVFEIIGTVAFAISGAMEAIKKKMDLFGVAMLGIVTAVGGGVIRDVIIGRVPPKVFVTPKFAVIAALTACATFVALALLKGRIGNKIKGVLDVLYFFADTVGLAAFTVLGIESTSQITENAAVLMFVGVITGVGGGVLRDVLAGDVPSVFRKHIYAVASIVGAAVNIILSHYLPDNASAVCGFAIICIIRILAAYYRWNLPRIDLPQEEKENGKSN